MSRVITFSRKFPKGHPKEGEETYFVEQIYNSLGMSQCDIPEPMQELINGFFVADGEMKKEHTIRNGNRWKVGDKFSPRVWSAKPYVSPQITISPDIELKKVWSITIRGYWVWINGKRFSRFRNTNQIVSLAQNDGLEIEDFWNWFKMPGGKTFRGQILCWNDNIEY